MRGFYMTRKINVRFCQSDHIFVCIERERDTLLRDAMASTTSLVNVFPTPDDPINTVGLMSW